MGRAHADAVAQCVLRRTLQSPALAGAFLDEVCGTAAAPRRRALVARWLATHPTPRLLTSGDPDAHRAAVASLTRVLGAGPAERPEAQRLVGATRRALHDRVPPAAALVALATEIRAGATRATAAGSGVVGKPSDGVVVEGSSGVSGGSGGSGATRQQQWRHAEERGDVTEAFRWAQAHATDVSRNAALPPELVVAMATIGSRTQRWSVSAALVAITRLSCPGEQSRAVKALVTATVGEVGWPVSQALATARRIDDGACQASAVAAVAPLLAPHRRAAVVRDAWASALAASGGWPRARSLAALVPHLPGALLDQVAGVASAEPPESRAYLVAALARCLAPPARRALVAVELRAVAAATGDPGGGAPARALAWLAGVVPPALAGEAVGVAAALGPLGQGPGNEKGQAGTALVALALQVPADGLGVVCDGAGLHRATSRADVVAALVRHRAVEWRLVLAATAGLADERLATALVAAGPHLPDSLAAQAIALAGGITDARRRAQALAGVVQHAAGGRLGRLLVESLTLPADRPLWRGTTELAALISAPGTVLLAEALLVASGVTDDHERARSLAGLAPHLPAGQQAAVVGEALALARTIADEDAQVRALAALSPHLPPHQRRRVLGAALTAAGAIVEQWRRAAALLTLAPALPSELHSDGLRAARALEDPAGRVRVLAALAPHLPAGEQASVLQEACALLPAVSPPGDRFDALQALLPQLPPARARALLSDLGWDLRDSARATTLAVLSPYLPAALLPEALTAAARIPDTRTRARVLTVLAPTVPAELVDSALTQAGSDPDVEVRAQAMAALAGRLVPGRQAAVLREALVAAAGIADAWSRARALTGIAVHVSPGAHAAVIGEALLVAAAITEEPPRANTVSIIASRLPAGQLPAVIEAGVRAARTLPAWPRARALAALAGHLPPGRRAAVLDEAVAALQGRLGDDRAARLADLAPWLDPELHAQALSAVTGITNPWDQGKALAALAPHMPASLLGQALRTACAIGPDHPRAQALAALATRLASTAAQADTSHGSPPTRDLWLAAIRQLAAHGRPAVLSGIAVLAPWAHALLERPTLGDLAAAIK
ncbi:MAG: hypothetical protein WD250_05450 [Egibacteraceae bacterium]